ncbi:hypothetical protein ACO02O_11497 [Dirofilaria immitis]
MNDDACFNANSINEFTAESRRSVRLYHVQYLLNCCLLISIRTMTEIFPMVTLWLLLTALSAHADFQKIKYKNCKSVFDIKNVEVDGCVDSSQNYCAFKKGTTPNLRIEFVPTATTKTLETAVRAKLAGGVIVSFNLDEKDPCKGGNLTCPLKEGETYFYQQGVTILQEYPKVNNVQINWLINDKSNDKAPNDTDKREICIIFLTKIVE